MQVGEKPSPCKEIVTLTRCRINKQSREGRKRQLREVRERKSKSRCCVMVK